MSLSRTNTHTKSYDVGDVVRYETYTGDLRTVVVTAKSDNIKNGRAGFDGHIHRAEFDKVWGYDSQIIRVFKLKEGRWQ